MSTHRPKVTFNQRDVDELLALVGRACAICSVRHQVQVHHIVPREKGGLDAIGNGIPLCPNCHDAVHGSQASGRTTRRYTENELLEHRRLAIQRAQRTGSQTTNGTGVVGDSHQQTDREPETFFETSVEVSPKTFSGECPALFTFTAKIVYRGEHEISIQYLWERSDGGVQARPSSLRFDRPGTREVQSTWAIGDSAGQDPTFKPYLGWMRIRLVTSPTVVSNNATFSLTCVPMT